MNLADVMEELAVQLRTIDGLRCYGYPPPGTVAIPGAVVSYPTIAFDATMRRGFDRYTLQVVVVVGEPTDQRSRDRLGVYCNGSGAQSVKAVLQAGTYTTFDTIRVAQATPDLTVDNANNVNLAMRFDIEITGPGA